MELLISSAAVIMALVASNAGLYYKWRQSEKNTADRDHTIKQLQFVVNLQNGMLAEKKPIAEYEVAEETLVTQ